MAVGRLVAPLVWSMVSDRPDLLFSFAGDGAWWLGSMSGGQLTWSLVNQTPEFGERLDGRHEFWIGNFTGVAPCGIHRPLI